MRKAWFVVAALVLASAPGCIVHGHGHGSIRGAAVVHSHSYVFFPDYHAYYCTSCDDWWALEAGTWVHMTVRPPHVHLSTEVAWVEIDESGPEPFVGFRDHNRRYPQGWKPDRDKGPPPGRGWRK